MAYGEVVDIPFPVIAPTAESEEINSLVQKYLDKLSGFEISAVMLQGEFVFTYRLTTSLKSRGVKVLSACSERRSVERIDSEGKTQKVSVFEFVQFREY